MNNQGVVFSTITLVAVAVIASRMAYHKLNRKLAAHEANNARA